MTYQSADRLDPPMVEVLEDDQWWDGHVEAQEKRDDVWWVKAVYRRDGQRADWFPADQVRPDETDYARLPVRASVAPDSGCQRAARNLS